ncbi:MAG: toll/interleukin-1 receptor domain-containing protein [Lachnospiraceae bacterium]|nr:toll/interleukin-1 receptor domain-containing protein [Lachnospiraceae bacterium]
MGLNEIQKRERSEFLEKNLKITECSQRKPYVFISYASDNWETVFKSAVVPMQQKYGLRVYADKAFDKVNDKWIVPMLRNVRGADMFVAFISQSYIESYACFLELLTAINNKKQLVVVTLEEKLHLGDTTSLPMANRGVKNEILNQGANIATNTNNTSNDVMRAMKSAFTSLSTLLEQDALSKYDISDAFINFLRDASLNQKTINDLKSLQKSIKSVSSNVFDPSLVVELNQKAEPKPVEEQPKPVEEQPRPVEEQPKPSLL